MLKKIGKLPFSLLCFLIAAAPVAARCGDGGGEEDGGTDDAAPDAPPDDDADHDAAPDPDVDTADDPPDDPAVDPDLDVEPDSITPDDIWIAAYIASWNLYVPPGGAWGNLPPDEIDFDAFTHGILFAVSAESDGTLGGTGEWENFNVDRIEAAVAAAHAAGRPLLFSVGGWGNYDGFSAAIRPGTRDAFVGNLTSFLETWGFDGIDLDMEPIESGDEDNYRALVEELRGTLDAMSTPMLPRPLLTAAVAWRPEVFAAAAAHFDQINIMTYDMSGPWDGWVTWHNAPVLNGGYTFPSTGGPLPCADGRVDDYLAAGVPAEKLGIGLDFYGYVWRGGEGTATGGASEPRQEWTSPPSVEANVAYHEIMGSYYSPGSYHWDEEAQAAWLGFDEAGSADDVFISFDDETTAEAKVDYVRTRGIGGLIIWELSGGYRESEPEGSRDLLLQAVKQAAFD